MGVMMIYGQCGQYNTRSIGYIVTTGIDLQGFMRGGQLAPHLLCVVLAIVPYVL